MKYAIIIDSVTAVPNYFIEQRPFAVMPVTLEVDGELMPDNFSEDELINFYKSGDLKVKTSPPSKEQISDLITQQIAPDYDYAFCQTISKQISPTFDNFQDAAQSIAKAAKDTRVALDIKHSFHMHCLNTGSTISGAGLIAVYADMLLSKGFSYNDYISTMEKFRRVVQCYAVVTDVMYSRARALDKGIKSMSLPTALLGKAVGLNPVVQICYDHVTKPVLMKRGVDNAVNSLFQYASERIEEGLYAPVVNISYGGDTKDLDNFENYQHLLNTAKKHKVKVLVGVMSLSSGMVFGSGGITMGIAPKNQEAIPT